MNKRLLIAATLLSAGAFMSSTFAQNTKPTIVLVHGAFAESSSWNGVVSELLADGYPVVAAANPLRSLKYDADYVASVIKGIKGPIVLVGHSYGGSVITNAATGNQNVKALVYVSAFALDKGETTYELSSRFPGGTLGATLAPPVTLPTGGKDLYIQQDKYGAQFAADVSASVAKLAASTQRPITEAAGTSRPVFQPGRRIPSWHIYGDGDKNISAAAMAFMAERAKSKETVVIKGASHVPMMSRPDAVAGIIKRAATAK